MGCEFLSRKIGKISFERLSDHLRGCSSCRNQAEKTFEAYKNGILYGPKNVKLPFGITEIYDFLEKWNSLEIILLMSNFMTIEERSIDDLPFIGSVFNEIINYILNYRISIDDLKLSLFNLEEKIGEERFKILLGRSKEDVIEIFYNIKKKLEAN